MNRWVGCRWWCKMPGCHMWGLGGIAGWIQHHTDKHQTWDATARLEAYIERPFGFGPTDEARKRQARLG